MKLTTKRTSLITRIQLGSWRTWGNFWPSVPGTDVLLLWSQVFDTYGKRVQCVQLRFFRLNDGPSITSCRRDCSVVPANFPCISTFRRLDCFGHAFRTLFCWLRNVTVFLTVVNMILTGTLICSILCARTWSDFRICLSLAAQGRSCTCTCYRSLNWRHLCKIALASFRFQQI